MLKLQQSHKVCCPFAQLLTGELIGSHVLSRKTWAIDFATCSTRSWMFKSVNPWIFFQQIKQAELHELCTGAVCQETTNQLICFTSLTKRITDTKNRMVRWLHLPIFEVVDVGHAPLATRGRTASLSRCTHRLTEFVYVQRGLIVASEGGGVKGSITLLESKVSNRYQKGTQYVPNSYQRTRTLVHLQW